MSKNLERKILVLFFLLMAMIFLPLLSVCGKKQNFKTEKCEDVRNEIIKETDSNYFTVLDESSGKNLKIPDREFVYGVVASEMPALFEKEALKAQAVASYTYFSRQRTKRKQAGKQGCDFTVNTEKWINYIPQDKLKAKWGSNFEKHYEKIKKCVDAVFPQVLEEENGELILAMYHAISSGKTEKCEDVFGGSLKYLTNVESPGDKLEKGYETKSEIGLENFKKIIESNFKNASFEGKPSSWVKNPQKSSGGRVKNILICGENVKGSEIRKIFGLRSSDFDLSYNEEEGKFVFTVRGYGHGVGMSQAGANYMAKQGESYEKILSWYYPGTSIAMPKNL